MPIEEIQEVDGLRRVSEELFKAQTVRGLMADALVTRLGDALPGLSVSDDPDLKDTLSGWIVRNMRAPKDPRNVPFGFRGTSFEGHFYDYSFQRQIIDDPTKHVVVKKAAQIGVSEIMARLCAALLMKYQPSKALYAFPTYEDIRYFSDTRIRPILEGSPIIRRSMRGTDNQSSKRLGMSFLLLRGGKEYRHAQTVDADFLFVDEYDLHNMDLIESFEQRVSASHYGWRRYFSTPRYINYGIDLAYQDTDKKEWYDVCWNCSHEQVIGEEHIQQFETKLGLDYQYVCLKCEKTLEAEKRTGFWKPTAFSKKGISGYHVSHFMSPTVTAKDMVISKTEMLPMNYENLKLGIASKGGLQDVEMDYGRIGPYTARIDCSLTKNSVMSIDWGQPYSWAEVSAFDPETGERAVYWVEIFKSERHSEHAKRMAEIALRSGVRHVICDIGYSQGHLEVMQAVLKDRFWTIATNSTELRDPRFDFKKRHVTWGKLNCVKEHYAQLRLRRLLLPSESPMADVPGQKRLAHHIWVEHHKSLTIVAARSNQAAYGAMPPEEEIQADGPVHLAMVSSYATAFCRYLSQKAEREKQWSRTGFRARVV
jgi:hypothetical protein